jgi:hypothetical protein
MQNTLPKDPYILLSSINMKLRDEFSNLESLCKYYNVQEKELTETLKTVGYSYDPQTNQFKS